MYLGRDIPAELKGSFVVKPSLQRSVKMSQCCTTHNVYHLPKSSRKRSDVVQRSISNKCSLLNLVSLISVLLVNISRFHRISIILRCFNYPSYVYLKTTFSQ